MSNLDDVNFVVQKASNAVDEGTALRLPADPRSPDVRKQRQQNPTDKHKEQRLRRSAAARAHHVNKDATAGAESGRSSAASHSDGDAAAGGAGDGDDDDYVAVKSNSTNEGSFDGDEHDEEAELLYQLAFFDGADGAELSDVDTDAGEGFGSYNPHQRKGQNSAGAGGKGNSAVATAGIVLWDSAAALMTDDGPGLRTWDGVFLPVIINLLGLIAFVKLPYCVAQCGLLLFWGLLAVCYLISGLVTISIAALSTNGHTGDGGPYAMTSRSLGAGVGLAVGTSFLVGNIVTGAFFVTGSSHFMLKSLQVESIEQWSESEQYVSTVVCASVQLLLLLVIALTGMGRAFRLLALALISVALIDLVVVCSQSSRHIGLHGFTGFNRTTLERNLMPQFTSDFDGTAAIGVLFPSVGGILCGITLSGEIRHAGKALPRGIGYAWLTSLIVYVILSFFIAAAFDRTVLQAQARSSLMDALDKIAYIPGGILACFAAVLANIVGSSRVLFAMAGDSLIPDVWLFDWFKARTKSQCVIICWAGIQVCVFAIGTQYNAASIVGSLVILSCYVALNLGCFLAGASGVISFRPIYDVYADWSALLGALLSFVLMIVIHPSGAAIVICLHFASQLLYGAYMDPSAIHWGDASQPLIFFFVRRLLLNLDERREHIRHWRPSLLHLVTDFHLSQNVIGLANNIKKGGLCLMLHALEGEFHETASPCHWMKRWALDMIQAEGMKAFCAISFGQRLRPVVQQTVRAAGLGAFRPNSVLLSLDELHDAPRHRAGLRTPSAAELAIFAGSQSRAAALARGAAAAAVDGDGGDGAVLAMERLSTLSSDAGIRPSTLSAAALGSARRNARGAGDGSGLDALHDAIAEMPESSGAEQRSTVAAATVMKRASKLLTHPDAVQATKLRHSLEAHLQQQQQNGTSVFTTSFAEQQGVRPSNGTFAFSSAAAAGFAARHPEDTPAAPALIGNINASAAGLNSPAVSSGKDNGKLGAATAAAAAAAAAASASAAAPASPVLPPSSPAGGRRFPSEEDTKPFRATLNEDLGDEARLKVLLDNLRLFRELAHHTNSVDGLTYKDDREFAEIAHDVTRLHLNLFVARNFWKLDGPRIRRDGDRNARSDSSDDDDGEHGGDADDGRTNCGNCCRCLSAWLCTCTQKKQSSDAGPGGAERKKKPFYIDLISPDPSDAVIFLSAFCLSKTAVWKRGARLRVIDFVPTSIDIDDATNARKQMLKMRKIAADVRVIALDSLPPAAHKAVDAILEADIVHHQRKMATMVLRRTATAGAFSGLGAGAAGSGMQRTATMATLRRGISMMRAGTASSGIDAGGAAGSLGGGAGSLSGGGAGATALERFRQAAMQSMKRRASFSGAAPRPSDSGGSPGVSGLQSPLRQHLAPAKRFSSISGGKNESPDQQLEAPLLRTETSMGGLFPSLTLRHAIDHIVAAHEHEHEADGNEDIKSVATDASSRASDIGYIRRVLASSRKRSQLVNAIYRNMPELTERTGIIFARVPAFPAAAVDPATQQLTDGGVAQWLKELRTLSEGLPPIMMCCGEGPLASSDDW